MTYNFSTAGGYSSPQQGPFSFRAQMDAAYSPITSAAGVPAAERTARSSRLETDAFDFQAYREQASRVQPVTQVSSDTPEYRKKRERLQDSYVSNPGSGPSGANSAGVFAGMTPVNLQGGNYTHGSSYDSSGSIIGRIGGDSIGTRLDIAA